MISIFFMLGDTKFWCSILGEEINFIVEFYKIIFDRNQTSPEPLHPVAVELPEQSHHPGLLAGAGGSVHHQVREVPALDQQLQVLRLLLVEVQLGQPLGPLLVNPEGHVI